MRLKGKTAIITGAGRGIGRAIALRFAAEGAQVVVAEIEAPFGQEVAREVNAMGGHAISLATDVSDPDSVKRMVSSTVDRFGGVDVLVNNAAMASIAAAGEIQELDLDKWRNMFRVNLDGVLLCSQHAAKQMIAQGHGGRIVNIASIMGFLATPRTSAYQVSKRAVMGLTVSLAVELLPHGIIVNCIAPGWIDTRWNVETAASEEWHAKYIKTGRLPVRRQANPDEVASVALFFAGDDCTYVVGQTLLVDGGLSLTLE